MHSFRRRFFAITTTCFGLIFILPLCAQTHLPPLDRELPTEQVWHEQPVESQLPPQPDDAFDEFSTPLERPAGDDRSIGAGGMMGGPGGRNPFSTYAFLQPESNLRNQSGSLQVRGDGLSLGLPLSISSNGIWISKTNVEHLAFETDASLPGSTQHFPEDLWNINLGLMHIHWFDNGWTAGGMVGIGSASDKPFASIREMNINLLTFLSIPTRERDAWQLSLFYSPLGQLAFPLPGISYAWRPSRRFQMNIGLPFSLNYQPTDVISFDLNYLPLTNASATVRWTPSELWTLHGGYQTQSQGYQLAERLDKEERFFHFDQRLNLGVRRKLIAGFELECSAAYLFDRTYFRSDSFFSDGPELRVNPGTQLMLKLEWAR